MCAILIKKKTITRFITIQVSLWLVCILCSSISGRVKSVSRTVKRSEENWTTAVQGTIDSAETGFLWRDYAWYVYTCNIHVLVRKLHNLISVVSGFGRVVFKYNKTWSWKTMCLERLWIPGIKVFIHVSVTKYDTKCFR